MIHKKTKTEELSPEKSENSIDKGKIVCYNGPP